MKDFSIFVEGDSDKRFIEDYLFFLSEQDPQLILPEGWQKNIYKTNGWTNLSSAKNEAERNIMIRTTRQGGVNLVIFDADVDAKVRKAENGKCKMADASRRFIVFHFQFYIFHPRFVRRVRRYGGQRDSALAVE